MMDELHAASASLFDLTFHHSPLPMAILEPGGLIRRANPALLDLVRVREPGDLGRVNVFQHPRFAADVLPRILAGEAVEFESFHDFSESSIPLGRSDTRSFHVKVLPAREGARITGHLVIVEDLTDRNLAIRALGESEEKYRKLVESMDSGLVIFDDDLRVVEFHDTRTRVVGIDPVEIVGRDFSVLHPGGLAAAAPIVEALDRILETGETLRFPSASIPASQAPGGRDLQVDLCIFRVTLGGRRHVACFLRDVTDQKRLQEQFVQAQKMESIGRLASGIAHDFNNLLSAILGNADLLEQRQTSDTEAVALASEIKRAGKRAAELIERMMTFSRRREPRRETLEMAETLRNLTKILARAKPPSIALELDLPPDPLQAAVDRTQVETALMNLLVNAVDAMPSGGTLSVRARSIVVDKWKPGTNRTVGEGAWVRITVADTGHGMDEQTRIRVFEPFFTTKPEGKGTGLGLYTVYGIVQAHGGHILVASEQGKGTSFDIYLPAGNGVPERPSRPSIGPPLRGHGTVLVVDDEEIVRTTVANMLSSLGYGTVTARGGLDALEILDAEKGRVDLVLLDLFMEDIDGAETLRRIRAMRDSPRVLLMSGRAEPAQVDTLLKVGASGFLAKPFTLNRLSRSVRSVFKE